MKQKIRQKINYITSIDNLDNEHVPFEMLLSISAEPEKLQARLEDKILKEKLLLLDMLEEAKVRTLDELIDIL
jgi:hypothetical protein